MYSIEEMEKLIKDSKDELNRTNEEIGNLHDIIYGFNPYHHSKIYKIVSDNTDKIYIGSTIRTLDERLGSHKRKYKSFLNNKYHNISSFEILEFGNYRIELIKNVCVSNKKDLETIEGKYIKKTLNIVNKYIPGRTDKEYRDDNREKIHKKNLCECGKYYTYRHKQRHLKSSKHITIINIKLQDKE